MSRVTGSVYEDRNTLLRCVRKDLVYEVWLETKQLSVETLGMTVVGRGAGKGVAAAGLQPRKPPKIEV
jgi:hypothetical protein